MKFFTRLYSSLTLATLMAVSIASSAAADEGMYPVSEIARLGLANKGMKIDPASLFNPGTPSVVDGICRVNGCTGSFISDSGLIITNHHCAFEAIQNASSQQRDLLADGFVAPNREGEIPAPGYTVRITQGYKDVSQAVLSVVVPDPTKGELSAADRTKAIDKRRKELEQAAEKENPGMRAEIAEMFTGRTYVLFLYTYLKDVRLVFAPPISIGAFGGETDNWEWPRHTGDFSLMRAYTAPDGSAADYSPNNIPFKPKKFIQVNPKGVDENDFVFILGYPGRTVRHKTASFIDYEQKTRLPTIVDLYAWQISVMENMGKLDRAVAIKHSSRTKGLANVEKRSRGQLQGLLRTNLRDARFQEETKLQKFIDSQPATKEKYGNHLRDIEAVYREMSEQGPLELNFRELRQAVRTLSFAFTIYDGAIERAKADLERETPYMNRNFDQTLQQLKLDVQDLDLATDRIMLKGMLERLQKIPAATNIPGLADLLKEKDLETVSDKLLSTTKLGDVDFVVSAIGKTAEEIEKSDDPVLKLMVALYPTYRAHREIDKSREGKLNGLYGTLLEVKQTFLNAQFVPDANSTLRITFGKVRGYSPQDAVYKSPITTLQGIVQKTTGVEPFVSPKRLLDLIEKKEYGSLENAKLKSIPVAILYDTDTTGGNSGSPVLDAQGRLIAVNFDRTFEATINDFAWNTDYSRSIGVDIRYVLWVTGTVYEAKHLTREMGVAD